jgi:phage repressor protein C with HTH and peptisase S24 domain
MGTNYADGKVIMPLRFDDFIKRVFDAAGINSQNELAEALGINRSAITQARKKGAVPDKWILGLYRKFGLNPDWLENGSGSIFLKGSRDDGEGFTYIPKVQARLCAGGGSFEVDPGVEGYYSFRQAWLAGKGNADKMVLVDVFGNSMEPELKDGDTVLIDQSRTDIIAGAVYAVGIDDTIMVKRVEKHPNRLVLRSDNTRYAPICLEKEEIDSVRVIGKVIWACRELH